MRDQVQTELDAAPEELGPDSDVPTVRHAWLGEAVPLCASESLRQCTIELRYVKYARQANCLECIARIR